ncbi:MAG: amidohydrolase [Bacteroidales bacterium]|nr:amidohydrolase [Bacteroidales bacterium]
METMKPEEQRLADILIVNAVVVTMDSLYRVFHDGAVAIVNDCIADLGPAGEITSRYRARRVIDGRGKLVMPGLVNVHTHSPMTIYRGFADDLPLIEWLYEHIFPVEAQFTNPANVRLGTELAIAEMLLSGTTTFNDTYYFVNEMARVVDQSGIRAVLAESLIDFPAPNSPTPADGIAHTLDLLAEWKDHPLVTIAVAAHTPFTASGDLIVKAKEIAVNHHALYNIHVAETAWEVEESMKKYGLTPVKYLYDLGVLDSQTIAAHCVHLNDDDIELFVKQDVAIGHNPQCNMKLANGVAPVQKYIDRGLRVGIGTDGVASNNDLDMFDEMRSSALAQKLSLGDPATLNARTVIEMSTIMGARAIGLGDSIGSLEAGKKADLIMLDLSRPHAQPLYNVYSLIAYSLRGSDVETVLVNGRVVVDERKLMTLDLERIYGHLNNISRQVKEYAAEKVNSGGTAG